MSKYTIPDPWTADQSAFDFDIEGEGRRRKANAQGLNRVKPNAAQKAATRQEINKWREASKLSKEFNKFKKDYSKAQHEIKKFQRTTTQSISKVQKVIKPVQDAVKKIPGIEKIAKGADKLSKAADKVIQPLNKFLFQKVASAKVGILLNGFASIATAGLVAYGAKVGEETVEINARIQDVVSKDLDKQLQIILATKRQAERLEIRVNANDAAIDTLAGGIGEKTKYIDRVINEFQLKLDGNKGITEVQTKQIANLANIFNSTVPTINQLKVDTKNIQAQIASILGRTINQPTTNQTQINQLSTRVSNVEKEVKQKDKEISELKKDSNVPANILKQIGNAVSNASNALNKAGKLEKELPGTVTKLVEKGVQDVIKEANKEITKEVTKLDEKKADKKDLTGEISKTKDAIATLINGQLAPLSAQFEIVKVGLGAVAKELTGQRTDIDKTKQEVTKQGEDIETLKKQNKEIDKMNREGNKKLDDLLKWSLGIAPILTAIPMKTGQLINPNIPTKPEITKIVKDNTPQQTCRFDPKPINTHTTALDIAQTALIVDGNAAIKRVEGTIGGIDSKLGDPLDNGGISGAIKRIFNNGITDRILNFLTFALSFHNALMLSNNLAQTLFAAIDSSLNAIGVNMTDAEGTEIRLGTIVSKAIQDVIKGVLGEKTYEEFSKLSASFNRIYQAASNILWNVQGMFDSARSIAEMTAGNIGKVGNALKRAGAVFENAYNWLPEQITARSAMQKRWDDIAQGIQTAESAISTVDSIAQNVISIKDSAKELQEQRKEFDDAKKDVEKALKDLATEEKNNSQSKDLDRNDKLDADDKEE